MLWENTLANFLGSLLAAGLLWLFITRLYELPRSKKERRELLASSYGLIKREIEAASGYCEAMSKKRPEEVSASVPITQAWETLHSTEAFRFFPPKISQRLVKCYSLLFRLKKNIELTHMLLLGQQLTKDPYWQLRARTEQLAIGIAFEVIHMCRGIQELLDEEVRKLPQREKSIFEEAYETPTVRPDSH